MSEEFLVILRERIADFLGPATSFVLSGLVFFLGRWSNWRRGCATQGGGFECGWSAIVSWLETRKGA